MSTLSPPPAVPIDISANHPNHPQPNAAATAPATKAPRVKNRSGLKLTLWPPRWLFCICWMQPSKAPNRKRGCDAQLKADLDWLLDVLMLDHPELNNRQRTETWRAPSGHSVADQGQKGLAAG
eukprot:GFKZ01009975.1.p1 GENE.GFKZ01009975.1~~GFKZ01009975.1.p1  ORF type:complete len:134 (+),score=8.06 GFKZ01009975.1:34-402(+)